jgi:thiamine biosynthesis lipoprotein
VIEETRIIMGMPIALKAVGDQTMHGIFDETFHFFERINQKYSPFIATSDVSRINANELAEPDYDQELQEIIDYAEKTKNETNNYFDVWHKGVFDPSGIVKGWAIQKASELMAEKIDNFYIDAGGDIQAKGVNTEHQPWRIGIRNPFDRSQNVAIVSLEDHAIATSGTAIRGQHIYNPMSDHPIADIVSLSVIAPAIIDADRMATAAFAMGKQGINFIEKLPGYEAYVIDSNKRATATSGWHTFEVRAA